MDSLNIVNLFPYSQLWRIGKEPYHSNKCTIIFSIIVIGILSFVIVERVISVFQKNTPTATSHVDFEARPPLTVISTDQNNN